MTDLAERLWGELAIETEEHFELIEPLLVGLERESATSEDVAQLFRSFHSVKGLARAIGLKGMETLAHLAESLLQPVRFGDRPLDRPMIGLLLETVDALKALRAEAVARRNDSPPNPVLIARLTEAAGPQTSGEAASGAGTNGTGITGNDAGGGAPGSPEAAKAQAATRRARLDASGLGDDPDMLIYFGELFQSTLPVLAATLGPELDTSEQRRECAGGLRQLTHAATVMNFNNLAVLTRTLCDLVEVERKLSDEERCRLIEELGAICQVAQSFGEETGLDLGLPTLAAAARPHLGVDGRRHWELARARIYDMRQVRAVEAREMAEHCARQVSRLGAVLRLIGSRHAVSLTDTVQDLMERVTHGELSLTPSALEMAGVVLETLEPVVDTLGAPETAVGLTGLVGATGALDTRDIEETNAKRSASQLIALFENAPDKVFDRARVERIQHALATARIKPALVSTLTRDGWATLVDSLETGRTWLYEVLAHFETRREIAARFRAWLAESDHRAVTNRTVLVDGKSWFEFLIASPANPRDFAKEIETVDQGLELLKVVGGAGPERPARLFRVRDTETATAASNVIRVQGETIDKFMSQIGEMVLVRSSLNLAVTDPDVNAALVGVRGLLERWRLAHLLPNEELVEVTRLFGTFETLRRRVGGIDQRLQSVLARLQEGALELRVVPIDTVFNRFPRMVRDLAQACEKSIRLELTGRDVRIDKGMVETLVDPLVHMIRNAVDHGIEAADQRTEAGKPAEGLIHLHATQQHNQVVIEISDDGRGLDRDKIRERAVERGLISAEESLHLTEEEVFRFIFVAGFSTADTISETSGRGVGMDVVNINVSRLGGRINVRSTQGVGTTISLHLPLSAAIQNTLLVDVGGQMVGIPDRFLAEVCQAPVEAIQSVRGQAAMLLRDAFLPIYDLSDLLGRHQSAAKGRQVLPLLVLSNGRSRIGVAVDRMYRRQELYVKDIHPQLAALPGVGGAAVLGDGRVVLILDGEDLFRLAERLGTRATVDVFAGEADAAK